MPEDPKALELVGTAATALKIAARVSSFWPQALAAGIVGGLVGDAADFAKGYFERNRARKEQRAQALYDEVLKRRLADIAEEIEVSESQVDLATHVFQRALEDDEDAKEPYYAAVIELVLMNQIDPQTLKILVSAIGSLAKIELDEFRFACELHYDKYLLRTYKLTRDGAPAKRHHRYKGLFQQRLLSVGLIESWIDSPNDQEAKQGKFPETRYRVSVYGNRLLFAVNQDAPTKSPGPSVHVF